MTSKWYEIPGISLLFLALTLVSTYPLIMHFDVGVPYGSYRMDITLNRSGDQMQLMYWFWLVKENILGNVPFDTNPFEFNMGSPQETTGFHTFPLALLFLLFSPLGNVAAYNCILVTSYILAGTYMYLLVRLYSGSKIGAILGSLIFTFAPIRINGITAGHAFSILFFLYPWIIYYLEKGIRTEKIIYGVLSGLGLLCLSMLESHLLYYMCVFLALYLSVRLVVMAPACRLYLGNWSLHRGIFSQSAWRCVFLLWGAGAGVVIYSQALFAGRDQDPFIAWYFWWIIGIYPFIAVLAGIFFALIYQRLSALDFRSSLVLETKALMPLYLFFPLSIIPQAYDAIDTTKLVIYAFIVVLAAKIVVIRHHLSTMLETLIHGVRQRKKSLWPVAPVIAVLGYIAFLMPMAKVDKLSATIASKGRTLHDVRLYSAHIPDVFKDTSNVYVGIVTISFLAFFLLALLWITTLKRESNFGNRKSDLLLVFYFLVAFCGYVLALGLAFGKSSLYLLLYYYFPYFDYPRVSDRILVLALFAMAIVIGSIVRRIQDRFSGVSLLTISGIILLLAGLQLKDFNLNKSMGVTILDKGQDIYTYVKNNRNDGLLLEIPLWPGDSHQSSLYQHYITQDRIPRINGYSPLVRTDYVEKIFQQLGTLNQGEMNRRQYELLKKLNVEFITVHNNRDVFLQKVSPYGPLATVRRLHNSPYLEHVDIDNHLYLKGNKIRYPKLFLFRVKDSVPEESANKAPAWYEVPIFFRVPGRLLHQVGEITMDEDINENVVMASEKQHEPGFLVYGPYTHHAAGEYRCYFNISTTAMREINAGQKIARIEVSKFKENGEQLILDQKELRADPAVPSYRREYLDFSLAEYSVLEFRVFFYGKGETRVEQVALFKRNHDIPLGLMEAEKMVGRTGQPVFEPQAQGGKAVEAIAGKSRKGDLVYGPNRVYPDGNYHVKYYLRLKDKSKVKDSQTAAVLSVSDEHNKRDYGRRKVRVKELNDTNYQAIGVDFEISQNQELSFKVQFTGKASLLLDKIEIERN